MFRIYLTLLVLLCRETSAFYELLYKQVRESYFYINVGVGVERSAY